MAGNIQTGGRDTLCIRSLDGRKAWRLLDRSPAQPQWWEQGKGVGTESETGGEAQAFAGKEPFRLGPHSKAVLTWEGNDWFYAFLIIQTAKAQNGDSREKLLLSSQRRGYDWLWMHVGYRSAASNEETDINIGGIGDLCELSFNTWWFGVSDCEWWNEFEEVEVRLFWMC